MSEQQPAKHAPIEILLVEDDPRDVELLQMVLDEEYPARIRVALTKTAFEQELEHGSARKSSCPIPT
jgi:hypothetical protein